MAKSRVPKEIPVFNQYINSTTDRLDATNPDTTNKFGVDYGFTPAEMTDWLAKRTQWKNTLYPEYSDPLRSTSIVKKRVRDFMVEFGQFAKTPLIKVQIATISGDTEESIFNIKIQRSNPSFPTEPIAEDCFASIRKITRGKAKISCRSSEDSKRSSIVEGADSIRYSYKIVEASDASEINPDDKSMIKELAFESIFELNLGAENQGKWLVIYFRWYLSRYPQFAGDWSGMQRVVIG